ncbi:MAG: sensor domain-containing diguanylate cyclase [Candidatus Latescibacteria bacterium]|nr:sensor domain-containing diguanylate cyclase [Candidatus Latescibacterota bacterium]
MYDGVYFVDAKRCITYWNQAASRITGYSHDEVMGQRCADNILRHVDVDGKNLCIDECPVKKTLNDGVSREMEAFLHHKKGHRVPVLIRTSPIRDENGVITGAVELFSDHTDYELIKQRLAELEKLAYIDELTQLANRRYIEISIEMHLQELKRYGWPFGILFIDIDNFKVINDTKGHIIGDKVLKMLSRTFSGNARPFDFFGRWGGEEFLAIIRNVDLPMLKSIAHRFRMLVEQSFITYNGQNISVTISIGATVGKANDTSKSLIERADKFLYQCKNSGKNCVFVDDI